MKTRRTTKETTNNKQQQTTNNNRQQKEGGKDTIHPDLYAALAPLPQVLTLGAEEASGFLQGEVTLLLLRFLRGLWAEFFLLNYL